MKRYPTFYNSEEHFQDLALSTRADKLGNIYHYVEYRNSPGFKYYARFVHLSSALDFIHSNFK